MKHYLSYVLTLALLVPTVAMAAEQTYPLPLSGQAITVEDSVYGVLRTNRALRGIQENRNVLENEVDRAKAGFGPRVDVTARGGGSVLSDSSTRSRAWILRCGAWLALVPSLCNPSGMALPPGRAFVPQNPRLNQ